MADLGEGKPFLIVYYGSDGSGGWQPLDRPLRTITTLDRFGLVTWEGDTAMLRMLQPSELARAMGFHQVNARRSFELAPVSRREKIRILGNGVCPPVMKSLVTHLIHQPNE
jgi:DNA (cytosine-5)-methyltransferase 1